MTIKRCLLGLLLCYVCSITHAQMRWSQTYQNYIDQYKDLAIEQMLKYHIPASITLAQGLFESRAGLSELATKGNNHFGIKCHGWPGRAIYHDDDEQDECFRAYDNARQSYEDHSRFLTENRRYAPLFQLKSDDYKGWAYTLKNCGYATNPLYPAKLIGLIELYQLYQYDKAKSYDHFIAQRNGTDRPVETGMPLHPIRIYNDNYYLVARRGDTFKGIGKEVEISWRKLAKYNERDKDDVLNEGDIVYLKKKKRHAPKIFKNKPHTVMPGESMYSIAQKYGIRVKSLYKMNHLTIDYNIKVGDKLRVY